MEQLDRIEQWQINHQKYDEDIHDRDDKRFEGMDTLLKIVGNHLEHIQADMFWVKWILGGLGTIVTGVFIGILTKML